MSNNNVPIKDLAYELQLLLGAAEVIKNLEEHDQKQVNDNDRVGNLVNYFKDAGYLHSRNLYNFFCGSAVHDASIQEYTSHTFDVSLYRTWRRPLHQHVLHIVDSRNTPNNEIDGVHINTKIVDFADNIKTLWQEWIDNTSDLTLRVELESALENAKQSANDDAERITRLLK